MKAATSSLILGTLLIVGYTFGDNEGPVCHQCEKIRAYNAAHPENNYYWYDDYLKDQKTGTKTTLKQDNSQAAPEPQK